MVWVEPALKLVLLVVELLLVSMAAAAAVDGEEEDEDDDDGTREGIRVWVWRRWLDLLSLLKSCPMAEEEGFGLVEFRSWKTGLEVLLWYPDLGGRIINNQIKSLFFTPFIFPLN